MYDVDRSAISTEWVRPASLPEFGLQPIVTRRDWPLSFTSHSLAAKLKPRTDERTVNCTRPAPVSSQSSRNGTVVKHSDRASSPLCSPGSVTAPVQGSNGIESRPTVGSYRYDSTSDGPEGGASPSSWLGNRYSSLRS